MSDSFYYTWVAQDSLPNFTCEKLGDYYFSLQGKKITDLSSVSFQASFGNHPKHIQKKVAKQLKRFPLHSPKAEFPLKDKVAQQLINLLGLAGGKILFTVSGAEAIENAVKMARVLSGKNIIAAREKSYHGATLGALSVGGDWRSHAAPTVNQWTIRLPEPYEDPDASKAREIIKKEQKNIAAICLETITGANGVIVPPDTWYEGIQKICDDFDVMLILDEVLCGFYRTGKAFAFHHYPNLKPSFVCMAKAITGGVVPFGAVWTSPKISKFFDTNILPTGLTNYAHPLGLAATSGVLEYTATEKFGQKLEQNQKIFHHCLSKISEKVKSKGMLAAIEPKRKITWQELMDHGLHTVVHNENIILAPALDMPQKILTKGMEKLAKILA